MHSIAYIVWIVQTVSILLRSNRQTYEDLKILNGSQDSTSSGSLVLGRTFIALFYVGPSSMRLHARRNLITEEKCRAMQLSGIRSWMKE
jgi:hypothetical protein